MLEKVIDLGATVPGTGERRVRFLDAGLVKTASSEIQDFWDGIQQDKEKCFLWVIGVSAREYYGCNNNGDAFSESDLRKCHSDFVKHAHVFLHHVNKDPRKSIGVPVFSWYNEDMHRVELILRVDKSAQGAEVVTSAIAAGKPVYVSMGCRVEFDVCSICGNKAPTRAEYCDHLRYNLKKILPDGRQVFAHNPSPHFFDISVVSRPADPMAHTLDKIASEGGLCGDDCGFVSSASLGEQAAWGRAKLAGLHKLSDLVKQVEGRSVDSRDDDPDWVPTVRSLSERGFDDMDFPHIEPMQAENLGLSPAGMLLSCVGNGAMPGFSEAAWMAGKLLLGRCPTDDEVGGMFRLLPWALDRLSDNPSFVDDMVGRLVSSYGGEFDMPARSMLIIKVVRPVCRFRMRLGGMRKTASFGKAPVSEVSGDVLSIRNVVLTHSARDPNFAQITFRDDWGNEKTTTPYHLRSADAPGKTLKLLSGIASLALGLGSVGTMLYEPRTADAIIRAAALAVPAAALGYAGLGMHEDKVVSTQGIEVPNTTLLSSWGREKRAGLSPLTVAGMLAPAALAMDYGYNRWRWRQNGVDPTQNMGGVGRGAVRAGKFVMDHPITTTLGSGFLGAMAGQKLRGLRSKA